MNLNYSYRAFLITSLLFGSLFLMLYNFKLGGAKMVEEPLYDFEYAKEELSLPDENLAVLSPSEKRIVETNKAYNEAERFISEVEASETEIDDKLAEMDAAIDEAISSFDTDGIKTARKKILETRKKIKRKNNKTAVVEGAANKNTTIRYHLPQRQSLYLPNPVYTCDVGGIIVINIDVSALGKVTKAGYNKRASSTQNGCLIESALKYAKQGRFTTAAKTAKQKGTITYNFPGQE